MRFVQATLAAVLLLASFNSVADEVGNPPSPSSALLSGNSMGLLSASPCKPSGDGTYTEMITTMASVLPPALGDAFLARYCEECMKKKFSVANIR